MPDYIHITTLSFHYMPHYMADNIPCYIFDYTNAGVFPASSRRNCPPRLVETVGLAVFLLRMKVPAAPYPHAELQEVPPTSARQRNLQAPAEVGTR